MKKLLTFLLPTLLFLLLPLTISAAPALAAYVRGYYKSNGTYVNGYYRSDPNGLKYDNYSWRYGDSLYNNSYYSSGRSSSWYTPSWNTQSDYWTGLDSYSSRNNYRGWYSSSYSTPSYNYNYSWDY